MSIFKSHLFVDFSNDVVEWDFRNPNWLYVRPFLGEQARGGSRGEQGGEEIGENKVHEVDFRWKVDFTWKEVDFRWREIGVQMQRVQASSGKFEQLLISTFSKGTEKTM